MKKPLTFWDFLGLWCLFDLVMLFLNGATVKSPLLTQIVSATLGIILLIKPLYPDLWEAGYGPEKSQKIIRIAAVIQIFLVFSTRMNF